MVARSIAITFFAILGSLTSFTLAKAYRLPITETTESLYENAIKISGETGLASIYGYAGDKTSGGDTAANGEKIRTTDMSAAHKSIPFGTMVRVTNLVNGLSAVVRINDRGPFVSGRIIDLTPAAAKELGFTPEGDGIAPVTLTVLTERD